MLTGGTAAGGIAADHAGEPETPEVEAETMMIILS